MNRGALVYGLTENGISRPIMLLLPLKLRLNQKAVCFVTSIKLKRKETLNLVVLFCVRYRATITQLYHKHETEKQIMMCVFCADLLSLKF